jgi:hypothetical protein
VPSSPTQSPPQSPSSGDEIPPSFQAIVAQLGALANVAKVSDIESNPGSLLREMDHQNWTCLGAVQLPDLPIWFEHQVRGCPTTLSSVHLTTDTLLTIVSRLELQAVQIAPTV